MSQEKLRFMKVIRIENLWFYSVCCVEKSKMGLFAVETSLLLPGQLIQWFHPKLSSPNEYVISDFLKNFSFLFENLEICQNKIQYMSTTLKKSNFVFLYKKMVDLIPWTETSVAIICE